jgi:hypothetical protein
MRPRLLVGAFLIVVSGALAGILATTGEARSSAPGDGCLVVSKGFGKMTITLTRGVIFGRFQEGSLTYVDLDGDDTTTNLPKVPGVTPTKFNDHVWKFVAAGPNVRFRSAGPTKLIINAQSVDLSVAGKGTATLFLDRWIQDFAGKFSVDADSFCEDNFQKMPLIATKFQISSPVAG